MSQQNDLNKLSPDQLPQGWSGIATDYERAFEKLTYQFSCEALRLLDVKPGDKVLDVAAGTGSFSLEAARVGGDVLATDFAPGMIDRLQERIESEGLDNIKAVVMDGQNLDVEDASYDFCASIVGVIFFPDIDKGLSELKRILKPHGRCAVVCWDHPEHFEMMNYLKQAIAIAVPEFDMPTQTPVWARMVGEDQLKERMLEAGFEKVTVITMQGKLELESPKAFWEDFTSSAPPLATLFEKLGEENTNKVGDKFVEIITDNGKIKQPSLSAQACIGIGYVNGVLQ